MTQKKVLLIGFDIRLPKILEYLNETNSQGVTNFIINKDLSFSDIIHKSNKLEGVDVITSGIIPPNPAELLMNERVKELFIEARKNYDYIIVDTAPVGLVTDTYLIKDYADLTVYITRMNVLEKNSLGILKDIYQGNKLTNLTVLVNGLDYSDGHGVRRGYGYGYTENNSYIKETKKWNILRFLKRKK